MFIRQKTITNKVGGQRKEQGKALIKLLFAIFIIALFLGVGNFKSEAFNLEGFLSPNIPAHHSLKQVKERNFIINGLKTRIVDYQGENIDLLEIKEYYKKVLLQREYKVEQESSEVGYFFINFVNRDLKNINIVGQKGRDINKPEYIFVTVTFVEEGMSKLTDYFSNPDLDMPGEDIAWLKRYPQSRRTSSTIMVDDGITTINYSLDNQSCIQCVVSFYKEEMLKKGWLLESEFYQTKDEMERKTNLNIEALKKQFKETNIPAEQKDKLGETIKQFESIMEKSKEQGMDMTADEITTLNFKKSNERCIISVTYKKFEGKQGRFPQEFLAGMEKHIQTTPEDVGNKLKIVLGLDLKEAVYINILYMPTMKALGRQKKWF